MKPLYAPRWSSQLPESYLPNLTTGNYKNNARKHLFFIYISYFLAPDVGRWSAETASDNEFCNKKGSPNPLPNPDTTGETCLPPLQSEQYMMQANYDAPHYISARQASKIDYLTKGISNDNLNYEDYAERCSDEDKHHGTDKYLFPYTGEKNIVFSFRFSHINIISFLAEEDHISAHGHYIHATTNDINNPGVDYHGSRLGSRMGSVLGSLHGGSVCGSIRGSPSPLMPPVSMMHSTRTVDDPQ